MKRREPGGAMVRSPHPLREPRIRLAVVGLVVLFALGLIGFYHFSANKGDGLEATMEEGRVEEGEPVWSAPLEYGEDYGHSLAMGLLGFLLLMALTLGYGHLIRWRQRADT